MPGSGDRPPRDLEEIGWQTLLVNVLPKYPDRALFDWASGLIFIRQSLEAFNAAVEAGVDAEPLAAHTVTHEYVHLLQAVSCGYLRGWLLELHRLLLAAIRELGLPVESKAEMASIVRQLAKTLPADLLHAIYTQKHALNARGPLGLSVSSLIEGHAFFVQLNQHVGPWRYDKMLAMLGKFSPAPEYRHAFDVARHFLVDGAMDAFPALCFTALCAANPPHAFLTLCLALRRSALLVVGQPFPHQAFEELAVDTLGNLLLGTAFDFGPPPAKHPIYSRFGADSRIGSLSFANAFEIMSRPSGLLELAVEDAQGIGTPLVFSPEDEYLPVRVGRSGDKNKFDEGDVAVAFALAAVNSRIGAPAGSIAPKPMHYEQRSWLQRTNTIKSLKVPVTDDPAAAGRKFAAQFLALLDKEDNAQFRTFSWGTYILGPDGLAVDARGRRFVSGLADALPWFPLHLYCADDKNASFTTWFGALTLGAADTRPSAPPPSHVLREALSRTIGECLKRAVQLDQDPGPQIVALTSSFSPADAIRLIATCSYWQEQLPRLFFEVDFILTEARAVEVSANVANVDIALVALGLAGLGSFDHLFDIDNADRQIFGDVLSRLRQGRRVLVIDRTGLQSLSHFGRDWGYHCDGECTETFASNSYWIDRPEQPSSEPGFLAILRAGPHLCTRSPLFELLKLQQEEIDAMHHIGEYSRQGFDMFDTRRAQICAPRA